MQLPRLQSKVFSIKSDLKVTLPVDIKLIFYELIYKFVCKFVSENKDIEWADKKLVQLMQGYNYIFLAPGGQFKSLSRIEKYGEKLIIENINTHQTTEKNILDYKAIRLGLDEKNVHKVNEKKIEDENRKLELVDFVFSPIQLVTESLISAECNHQKIINNS